MKIKYTTKKMDRGVHSYIGSYDINNETFGDAFSKDSPHGFREYVFYVAVDVNYCCEKMKEAYGSGYGGTLHFADIEETGEFGLCIMNSDDNGYFPEKKIDYCPFCGAKIETKEEI